MSYPEPKPGLVIRYSFLWSHEAEAGADEAAKDRPLAIVAHTESERCAISIGETDDIYIGDLQA